MRGELEDAAGVGDDLDGLDAGDLVEEPAAAGVHELGVTFELEEFEDGDAFRFGEFAGGVLLEEFDDGGGGAVEDDLDVGVAGGPEIFEEGLGELLGEGSGGVAEVVEGFAERRAPLLVPAGLGAAVAAAVGAPALDAVGAGPGGVFDDFGLPFGRKVFEKFAVVGEASLAAALRSSAWRRRAPSRRACGGDRSFRRRWRRGRAGRLRDRRVEEDGSRRGGGWRSLRRC